MDNPALIERLGIIAKTLPSLPHGEKSRYLAGQASQMGMSVSTLYRKLEQVTIKPARKKRSDAGVFTLSFDEAKLISSVVMEGMRKNGKRIMTASQAVKMLRANGLIKACHQDGKPLSENAISRSLKAYCLHPDQLLAPAPVVSMKSLHPNHVWQIDPSLCVLYYLPRHDKSDSGLRMMAHDEFYKNKPANDAKIVHDRVWRYTGTDHASGVVYCQYYFGGETSANLCDFFIAMMSQKADICKDPFCGVPKMVMLDPGSANTSSAFKNLCQTLGVKVQINKPKNPRAKGQVEKANDIVETQFESGLKFVKVGGIDELNELCDKWLRYFNGQVIHSRHGMTRYRAWLKITPSELVLAPPADYCRTLALSVPKEAKVLATLEIKYKGKLYDVSALPVEVAQKVLVAQNPWQEDSVRVCMGGEHGEMWVEVPEVVFDEMGFRQTAVIIGQEYHAHKDTKAQRHMKELEKLTMKTKTLDEAKAKRKRQALPFDGEIDPYRHNDAVLSDDNLLFMPKQGMKLPAHQSSYAGIIDEPTLSKVEIAKALKPKIEAMGGDWSLAVKLLVKYYPDGIVSSRLDEVFDTLTQQENFQLLIA